MAMVSRTGNTDDMCKQWRVEVAYRTLLLLRTVMAVMDYPTDFVPAWDLAEWSGKELEDIQRRSYLNPEVRKLAHEVRSEFEETMRVPIRVSYLLRKSIHSHSYRLRKPLEVVQESMMYGFVDDIMEGYYGIRTFLTTPTPFPMVQMARTFLFCYVLTIPFALLGDDSTTTLAHCIEVFILTYGFMGLELVAIELDNPFGNDENDFECVYIHIYIYIYLFWFFENVEILIPVFLFLGAAVLCRS